MTTSPSPLGSLARETAKNARQVALPTLPSLLLFAAAMGVQSWFNDLAGIGGNLFLMWLGVSLLTIFVGCFWSADMYRRLLPEAGTGLALGDAARLFLASLAVYSVYFIIGFFLTLFFSIFSGVLIGSAGYDPSEEASSSEAVRQSIEALSNSGGAAVLYILLFVAAAGLVWLGLRLFLFGAATVANKRLTIFRSWGWTSGHIRLIAPLWFGLQFLPWLVLTLMASGLLHLAGAGTIFSYVAASPAPEGAAASEAWLHPALTGAATLLLAPFYWLGHGLAVALYKHLVPGRVDADGTFG